MISEYRPVFTWKGNRVKIKKRKKRINIYQAVIMGQKESQLLYYSKLFLQLSYEVHIPIYKENAEAQKSVCPKLTQLVSSGARVCNMI